MRDDSPENDLKNLWQHQPTEPSIMTLQQIRQKARKMHTGTRRQLLGSLALPLISVVFYAFCRKHVPALQFLFAFPIAWSLAGLYFLNRGMWSAEAPVDTAPLATGLESYRREIERRRSLVRRILLWCVGPILLSIGTFIFTLAKIGTAERGIFPNALPFMTLVVVWIVAFFVIRMREQRELQREIETLNRIETGNHG